MNDTLKNCPQTINIKSLCDALHPETLCSSDELIAHYTCDWKIMNEKRHAHSVELMNSIADTYMKNLMMMMMENCESARK